MSPLLTYFGLIFLIGIKPGPGVAFFTSLSLSEGMKASSIAMLGCVTSHTIIVFLMLSGLNILGIPPLLTDIIQIIALIALLAFGIHSFFKIPSSQTRSIDKIDKLKRFGQGMAWPFTNPFNYVMYASTIPLITNHPDYSGYLAIFLISLTTAFLLFSAMLPYIFVAGKAMKYLKYPAIQNNMHKLTGVLCLIIAASLLPPLIDKLF